VNSEETWLWLFEWFEYTAPGIVVRESVWLFPVIEAVHLLGLCLLGGALLVVDLRMLGFGLRGQSISQLHRYMQPWLTGAVVLMLGTGVLLFLSEAVKCYYSQSFRVKIIALTVALIFTFTLRARIAADGTLTPSVGARLAAAASIMLWLTVAAAGRWIGFS
jgi:hypothetical protein